MSFPPVSGQTAYNFLMTVASAAGQLYDIGFNNVLTPVGVVDAIPMGVGVAKVIGADYQVRLPHQDIVAVTLSAPLSAGNSTVVNLNGLNLSAVVYATSNAATLTALAQLIEAQPFVSTAVSNGTDTITITADQGYAVSATFTTTGGSAVTWTYAYSNDSVFYGVSIYIQNRQNLLGPNGSAGGSPYFPGDAVPVLTRGRIWVVPENTVTSDSPVYWRVVPTMSNPQVGTFRSDSDGGNAILIPNNQVRWIVGASAGGFAVLDINQP